MWNILDKRKKPMEWYRLFKYWCDKLDEGKPQYYYNIITVITQY